jgi:hypothetical protein
MSVSGRKVASCGEWISPLRITLLVINAVCFGGCLVLLAVGIATGLLVLLTISTGLSFGAGLAGAVIASRRWGRHEAR